MPTDAPVKKNKVLPVALGFLGALLVCYLGFAAWLRIDGRFAFRTTLNGRDVSLRRALEVQETCMEDYYPNMYFNVRLRGGASYPVTPQTFDFSDADRAVACLPDNTLAWSASLFRDTAFTLRDGGALEKLARRIETDCAAFRAGSQSEPENAYLTYNGAAERFEIVPDDPGAAIDADRFEIALTHHVLCGRGDLDLDAAGLYRRAEVTAHSPALTQRCEALNRFLAAEVVYAENGVTEVFSARELLPYLSVSPDGEARYDAAAAAADGVFDAFAEQLAATFDYTGGERAFRTHDGEIVPVVEKTWRTKLDAAGTAAALAALTFDDLASGESVAGEFVWETPAPGQLTDYVEVDLTAQTLYLYAGGELVLETPVVSGCLLTHHRTPAGVYALAGKYRNVVLRGPDYANFVRWWMPFNKKIGLHDASWRSRFGETIYRANGSHGCVNLPREAAETIYNTIDVGWAVVCYWRDA